MITEDTWIQMEGGGEVTDKVIFFLKYLCNCQISFYTMKQISTKIIIETTKFYFDGFWVIE